MTVAPVAQQTRTLSMRAMLNVLNLIPIRRLLQVSTVEDVSDFNILNNTLVVKILDRAKIAKLNKEKLSLKGASKEAKKYAVGRNNAIQLAKFINLVNFNHDLKSKLTFTKEFSIINMLMHGSVVVINAVNTNAELARQKALEQQRQPQDRNIR